jgi:hypothetical protein
MDQHPPAREFGKRKPAKTPPDPPAKRSGHVALLLMGTLAVGGGAYALMPRPNCEPSAPGMAGPALPDERCRPSGSSGGSASRGGGHGGSSYFSSSGDASGRSASAGASESASGGVTRGGFGSFGHGFGSSGGE